MDRLGQMEHTGKYGTARWNSWCRERLADDIRPLVPRRASAGSKDSDDQ